MKKVLLVEDDIALSAGVNFELDLAGYILIPVYESIVQRLRNTD